MEHIMVYTYDEALAQSVEYFNGDELAAKVFVDKYADRDEENNLLESTPTDRHRVLAREFARVEAGKFSRPMTEELIFGLFDRFKFIIPQGSVMYGCGNNKQIVSLSNCFVISAPEDSYGGILKSDQELVQISKRRGGVGVDLSNLRYKGTATRNSSRSTSGIVAWMRRYSNSIREVGQDGRRGALMITLDIHHPDVLDFITIKNDDKEVTGANISIKLSNEFLQAVEDNTTYQLRFPIDSTNVVKEVSAREVWKTIVHSAWLRAEPGLLFWDNVTSYNAIDCYDEYKTTCCNPCAELPLCQFDSCRLMIQNLFSYVVNPFTKGSFFDFGLFWEHSMVAQRLMDDLIDLEIEKIDQIVAKIKSDPEDPKVKQVELDLWIAIREKCVNGRRTGLGITGEGDMLAALSIPYGSDESIHFVEKVHKTQKLASYRSSVEMAKELGPFPIWDRDKEKDSPFLLRIKQECLKLYEDILHYGRRNIGNLTIAPTGSMSMLTQTTSGIEPLFMLEPYKRRKKINPSDKYARVDFVDPQGDAWQEFLVYHPKVRMWMEITGETDIRKSPWAGCTAEELDWKQRVKLQAAAQRHIDHAISSCLTEDTLIQTDRGLFRLKELVENCPEKSFSDVNFKVRSLNKDGDVVDITQVYNNGVASVLKISTVGDYGLECTPNHKLLTINDKYELVWKEASEFNTDDILVMKKGSKLFGVNDKSIASLIGSNFEYNKRTNSKDITLPEKMSTELAELIGYLCSDGSVGINGISLSQQYNNVVDRFEYIVNNLFQVMTNRQEDERAENLLSVVANSRELSNYFKWIGLKDHDNLELPKLIRVSNSHCVRSFIKGLTLDGYVSKDNLCVMTSVCYEFLKAVQVLLFNLNIKSNIQQCNDAGYKTFPNGKEYLTKDAWCLCISDSRDATVFLETIGFAEDRKNMEALTLFKRSSKVKLIGEIPDFGFQVPKILLDETYVFTKIKSINYAGEKQTYDLSVPDGNSYIANGFIVHNTLNLPENVTEEQVDEIYRTAWKSGCKGITVYRKNCRTGVLVENKALSTPIFTRRTKELLADIYHVVIKGKPHTVLVGISSAKPYEVLVIADRLKSSLATGKVVKRRKGWYDLHSLTGELLFENITESCTTEEGNVTRFLSMCLRHNLPIDYIVDQISKFHGDINSFGKSIGRCLKKYIPDNTPSNDSCPECKNKLIFSEGCQKCPNCTYSKCG